MKRYTSLVLVGLIIVVSGSAFYSYRKVVAIKEDPSAIAKEEIAELVARVSKLILLPEGETPVLATVTDLESLKAQPFFAKAKIGDKVLLYQNVKKAYLFDPEANKIMEVAPIVLEIGKDVVKK